MPASFIWSGTACDPYSSKTKIDLLYAFTVALPGLITTFGFSISAIKAFSFFLYIVFSLFLFSFLFFYLFTC